MLRIKETIPLNTLLANNTLCVPVNIFNIFHSLLYDILTVVVHLHVKHSPNADSASDTDSCLVADDESEDVVTGALVVVDAPDVCV